MSEHATPETLCQATEDDACRRNPCVLLRAIAKESGVEWKSLERALEDIARWADAYPLDIFPEPDFKKARQLLEAGGMTLDAISASNMRHVVEGVGAIAKRALAPGEPKDAEGVNP